MTNPLHSLSRIPARRSTLLLGVALASVFVLYIFVRPASLPASRANSATVEQVKKDLRDEGYLPASPTASPSGRRTPTAPPASTGPTTPTPSLTPNASTDPSLTPPAGTATPDPSSSGNPPDPDGAPTDGPGLLWFTTPTPTPAPSAGASTAP